MITRSTSKKHLPINPSSPHTLPPTIDVVPISSQSQCNSKVDPVGSMRSAQTASGQSSSSAVARKATAVADFKRRRYERERELAKQLEEVEEAQLEADLKQIEAEESRRGSVLSNKSNSRTRDWVTSQFNNLNLGFEDLCPEIAPEALQGTSQNNNPTDILLKAVANTAAAAKAIATSQEKQCKTNLIPFYGNCLDWTQFKRIYNLTKPYFTNAENINRLQHAIRGPAREAVASILVCGEDPELIVAALEENFARPEVVVLKETAALKNLPRLGNDLKELGNLANRVRNAVSNIKLLNQVEYLYAPELFHAILGKLNPVMKLRWSDFAAQEQTNKPKLEVLSKFLVKEYQQFTKFSLSPELVLAQPTFFQKDPKRENIHVASDMTVTGPAGSRDVYALLDDGSTATIIEADIATAIGATGPTQNITVNGIGGLSTNKTISFVDFKIKGRYTHDTFLIKNARAMSGLSLSPQTLHRDNIASYEHLLDLLDILPYEGAIATPSILIGAEHWYLSITQEIRKGKHNEPVACLTALGWTLYGVASSETKLVEFVNNLSWSTKSSKNEELDLFIKNQYKLDSIGISKQDTIHSKQDIRAIHILEKTAKRLPSGRFEVGLSWRDDIFNVPDSYPQALSRFLSLEKRMQRSTTFSMAYETFINNMLTKEYAEECDPDSYHKQYKSQDVRVDPSIKFYLPHFGIYHPQKHKLRVVLDAAAKSEGINLNSLLIPGPDLLKSLLNILFRFREGRVALIADIKEMYSQIRVRKQDRDALRFLWKSSSSNSSLPLTIKEYRRSTVIFGASCSPFIAQFIKNKNAKSFAEQYPKAVDAILYDHYMDDYVGSLDSITEAAQLAHDIVQIHSAACMEMRGWTSNDRAALNMVNTNLQAAQMLDVNSSVSCDVKVLGVEWNPSVDQLGFRDPGFSFPITLTKREVLSMLMKVYDPLGLLGPIVVKGRILFQQTWRSGIDWDTHLPTSEVNKWTAWYRELTNAVTIKIPRWYASAEGSEPLQRDLHIFVDASEQAYACVAYWRFKYKNETIKVALICSKARVSPLKPTSIPRLELQAALIGSRLALAIQEGHRKKPDNIYYWTDSMIVLGWLRSDARSFKPFVAHRVAEICENSNIENWQWVPSEFNVADDITRSEHINFDSSHRWFTGPSFLLDSPENWPSKPTKFPQNSSELKSQPAESIAVVALISLPQPVTADINRFSNWLRLLRATARAHQAAECFRNFLACRQNSKNTKVLRFSSATTTALPPLTADHIKAAERHILQRAQMDCFAEELYAISNSLPLTRRSRLKKMSPVLKGRLLHMSGRIKAAEGIDPETRSPVLLDGHHPAVRLLIQSYHEKAGHANNALVINEIRQRFWIVGLRNTIRSIVNKCILCKIRKAQPMNRIMGDLPPQRLAHHQRPFTYTGIDYFGPITVTIGRRHEKRYVALLTCLTCRAIHLEIVHSLSSDSAIMALRRFIARRGVPHTIFSDNGTAFVGANRILQEFYSNSVEDFAASNGIK
ncbi:uncharacterized protein LOC106136136 [Amyelois transitella]|uniref:uncharacterized protein LOC106136136 n=1 Tax=Amyelois transitella TaxID=680683 RepID=UPI00298F8402|nr:uncharacterized protein LOC106136136 [Amyelois transitella]